MMVTSQINTEAEPMSPRIAQSPVMTDDEVAEFLRVSKEVVQQEISSGKLPALRIGSEWRIVRKDFEQFLRTQTTQPKAKSQNDGLRSIVFSQAKPFDHRWPEKKGQPKTPEHFDEAFAATTNTSTGMRKILVGFSFGKVDKRRKSTDCAVQSC
jgi:excisionase family DNA binding protein